MVLLNLFEIKKKNKNSQKESPGLESLSYVPNHGQIFWFLFSFYFLYSVEPFSLSLSLSTCQSVYLIYGRLFFLFLSGMDRRSRHADTHKQTLFFSPDRLRLQTSRREKISQQNNIITKKTKNKTNCLFYLKSFWPSIKEIERKSVLIYIYWKREKNNKQTTINHERRERERERENQSRPSHNNIFGIGLTPTL